MTPVYGPAVAVRGSTQHGAAIAIPIEHRHDKVSNAFTKDKMRSERSRAMFERLKDCADRINDQLGPHKASARSGSFDRHRALGGGGTDDSDMTLPVGPTGNSIFNGGRSAENGGGPGADQNVSGPLLDRAGAPRGAPTTKRRPGAQCARPR